MRVQATEIFLNPPSGPLLTGERVFHVEFQGGVEDPQNWFVGAADIKNAFHQMRILGYKRFLHSPLSSQLKLVTLEKRSTKNVSLPIP